MHKKYPNKYGFSDRDEDILAAQEFVRLAIADGWTISKYFDTEPVDQACKLSREGFKMSVLTRTNDPSVSFWKYEAHISIWGPDGLIIATPQKYDWDALVAALRHCPQCQATDVSTVRFSFAGRCCNTCLPEMRRIHELPGWCD